MAILTRKQTRAIDYLEDSTTKELLFGGGAGGAKSFLGCYWQIKQRLKYPETRGLIGRSKLKTLKETTLNTFWEVCKIQGLVKDEHYTYNSTLGVVKFYNGSEILLKDLFSYPSDPNFDELGSLEITDAFIDEANQITIKAKNIVKSRIRYKLDENNLIPKILYTCNPAKNWTYTEFYKPSKNSTLDSNRKFIQALVTDNPYISSHYIDNLDGLDYNSKQRLQYGNWEYDDDPSVLCEYDKIVDIFTNTHASKGVKYISSDLAMKGRDNFIISTWDGLRCRIETVKNKATGKSIEIDLKESMNNNGISHSNCVVDSDGMGNYLESYLNNIREFRGGAAAKDKDYFNKKSECAFKLAEYINKGELYVECDEIQKDKIIEELEKCLKRDSIDKDEGKKRLISKDKMKSILGRSPDYMDVLIMRMDFDINKKRRGLVSV